MPAPRSARTKLKRRWLNSLSKHSFVLPALAFLFVFMVYPLGYTMNLSMFEVNVGNFLSGGAPFVGLENYTQFISSPRFVPSLVITVVFTLGSLVFQHSIGFMFALFFNRGFPLSGLLRALMLGVWVLPAVVAGSLWLWILSGSFGLLNAFLGLIGISSTEPWLVNPDTALIGVIITNIWIGIPFHMMLLYAGLQGIPQQLYEAAQLDGASAWQRFWKITLPMMRSVVAITLLLGFVHTFKVFDLIYVMTAGGPAGLTNVLAIEVYKLSFEFFRFGDGAAAANVLLIIPLLLSVVYLWLRRREETTL